MSWESDNSVVSTLAVVIISLISGFISIANHIAKGLISKVTWLWIAGEIAAALLCGYLMWDAYPRLVEILPEWTTQWVAVALAAHFGGRALQFVESKVLNRISKALEK